MSHFIVFLLLFAEVFVALALGLYLQICHLHRMAGGTQLLIEFLLLRQITQRIFSLQTSFFCALEYTQTKQFCNFSSLQFFTMKHIFQDRDILVFNKTALTQILQCFIFLLVSLCFTQALLAVQQLNESLHLIVVKQPITIDMAEGITQIFLILCLVHSLTIGFFCQTVPEFTCPMQET